MDLNAIEEFKNLVLDLNLPREELILFGVVCPYCGKNDRVRTLEPPDCLASELEEKDLKKYQKLWGALQAGAIEEAGLAVCKFCHNVMTINPALNTVSPLY